MAVKKYYVGLKSGDLEIIEVFEGRPMKYKVRCNQCGREKIVHSGNMKPYLAKGVCGQCLDESREKAKIQNILDNEVGKTYGSLKILDYAGRQFEASSSKYPVPYVKVKCLKCGSITEMCLNRIKSNGARECKYCARKNLAQGHDFIKDATMGTGTSVIAIDGRRQKNKNNSSGYNGVSWFKKIKKWRAYIYFQRKQYNLGYYEKLEDAVAARKAGEEQIYGDFLNWYAETYPKEWEKIQSARSK